jgi:hypothetical protein
MAFPLSGRGRPTTVGYNQPDDGGRHSLKLTPTAPEAATSVASVKVAALPPSWILVCGCDAARISILSVGRHDIRLIQQESPDHAQHQLGLLE